MEKEDEMPPGRVFARIAGAAAPNGSLSMVLLPLAMVERKSRFTGLVGAYQATGRRKIVFSQRFEWIAAAIVVGNSLLVGIDAEYTLNNLNAASWLTQTSGVRSFGCLAPLCHTKEQFWLLRLFDIFFVVCFTVELGLRVAVRELGHVEAVQMLSIPQTFW